MIRVNIHFDPSWLKRLDEIKGKVQKCPRESGWLYGLTRADLIRFAVAQVFGLEYFYVHVGKEALSEALKKVLKKTASSKGV